MLAAERLKKENLVISPREIEKIVDLTLDTYEQEARKSANEYANSQGTSNNLGIGAATAAGAFFAAVPALLPIAIVAGGALGANHFLARRDGNNGELEYLRAKSRADVHNNVKKSLFNAIQDIVINSIRKLSEPKTRTYSGRLEGRATDVKPIEFSSAEGISSAFREHCEQQGLDVRTAETLGEFLKQRLPEGIKVLEAAQALRADMRLTPKPPVEWGKRTKLPAGTKTLGEAIGEYYPAHPAREQRLSDLDYRDWWSAFYEEDANLGKVNTGYLRDNDSSFYFQLKRAENEFKPISQLFSVPDFEGRSRNLGAILGDESSLKRIKGMFVKGNTVSPER